MTKEDQHKINTFSRLHNREKVMEEELARKQVGVSIFYYHARFGGSFMERLGNLSAGVFFTRGQGGETSVLLELYISDMLLVQKDKEDFEEISTELELADEDELVP